MTSLALLLTDPSASLRYLVVRDLLHRPDNDPELRELASLRETDPLVTDLVGLQMPDGAWNTGLSTQPVSDRQLQSTWLALVRLGYLGFNRDDPPVQRAAAYLFSLQRSDGSWPMPKARDEAAHGDYALIPLQTALPLQGLAACGYATDPRAERAYDWLLAQQLPDGAWPTGIVAGNYGFVAGYRRLPHSRWGCRSNTTAALVCLALHPKYRLRSETQRAFDLLLGRETRETYTLGFEVARLLGLEAAGGFFTFYARFDLALVLSLAWRVGASVDDARITELADFVRGLQGPYGLWDYPRRPSACRWITFDLLRSLSRLQGSEEWLSLEPRTPFRPYAQRPRRF